MSIWYIHRYISASTWASTHPISIMDFLSNQSMCIMKCAEKKHTHFLFLKFDAIRNGHISRLKKFPSMRWVTLHVPKANIAIYFSVTEVHYYHFTKQYKKIIKEQRKMRGKKAPKCRTCVKRFIADALLCTWQLFVLISRNVHHLVGGFELSCLRVINFLKNRVINKMEWRKILCKFNSAYTQYWRQYSYKVHRFVADEDLPACFYHTRAESARLSRKQRTPHNNQVKLKLKQMWNSSYCARACDYERAAR